MGNALKPGLGPSKPQPLLIIELVKERIRAIRSDPSPTPEQLERATQYQETITMLEEQVPCPGARPIDFDDCRFY